MLGALPMNGLLYDAVHARASENRLSHGL